MLLSYTYYIVIFSESLIVFFVFPQKIFSRTFPREKQKPSPKGEGFVYLSSKIRYRNLAYWSRLRTELLLWFACASMD